MTKRVNWYDFKRVTLEDLQAEQSYNKDTLSLQTSTSIGSGVILESVLDKVVFDTRFLSTVQNSYVSTDTFDGRGIISDPYVCSDYSEGTQISVVLSDTLATKTVPVVVTFLGTDFEDNLIYEHLVCKSNGTFDTYNHFKTIQNILFQNVFGNLNTTVDGVGCYALISDGYVKVMEAASCSTSMAENIASFTQPDQIFSNYKSYNPAYNLEQTLDEALNSSFDIDSLGIETTVTNPQALAVGGSSSLIYVQKFKMYGNNIQNIKLLLSLASGSTWSGSITVGIRKLQTSSNLVSVGRLLPTNPWDFEPEPVAMTEVSLSETEMLDRGIVLGSEYKEVDFCFSETVLGNANLSGLVDGDWYCVTVRRTTSSSVGTILVASNYITTSNLQHTEDITSPFPLLAPITLYSEAFLASPANARLYVAVQGDLLKVVNGKISDSGVVSTSEKTVLSDSNTYKQRIERSISGFANTSTGVPNYGLLESSVLSSTPELHPKSGDMVDSRLEDITEFSVIDYEDVQALYATKPNMVLSAIATDMNPRGNPTISGQVFYPGLLHGNIADIVNPPNDLLNYNVVGSIFIPNTLKTSLKYRIIKQEVILDGYGDLNEDGFVNLDDLAMQSLLDGYSTLLATTGTYSGASQKANMAAGLINAIDLIKANLNTDTEINSTDISALSTFVQDGTAFPNGQSTFNRVRLTLEPVSDASSVLTSDGISTLKIENLDTDLLSTWSAVVSWQILPVIHWTKENVVIEDIRRFCLITSTEFSLTDLSSGKNSGANVTFIPGDLILSGSVINQDGSNHALDYEKAIISIELPDGNTEKEMNFFENFVKNKMKFSDGDLVTQEALANNQILFEVSVSSYAKNMGLSVDGYVEYSDIGDDADEAIGTYIDQSTGLLRVRAYNIVNNDVRPEVRTRIIVTVSLKKAGWKNAYKNISYSELPALWM